MTHAAASRAGGSRRPQERKVVPVNIHAMTPAPLPHGRAGGEDENRCKLTAGDGRQLKLSTGSRHRLVCRDPYPHSADKDVYDP